MSANQLGTVAAAGAGFLLGGTGGAAVGWMVGSWIFSEKQDEKNEILDPGAEELPGFNQALRGVTIPVLFGTNRAEVSETWRKNFRAIRHEAKAESGAGGKSGGSGGGGKGGAGGGSGSASYTYTLDVMFHMGMSEKEYFLYGGWLANQRLNDQTINAIGQGFGLNGQGALIFGPNVGVPKEATLEYEEAYYYPGGDTSPGWTYFHEQESIPVTDVGSLGMRWHGGPWIGFKGLDLGQHPTLPLLQWEAGPGGGDLSISGSNFGQVDTSALTSRSVSGASKNGRWFAHNITAGDFEIHHRDPDTGAITSYSRGGSLITDYLSSQGMDHGLTYGARWCSIIPGTNIFFAYGENTGSGTRLEHGTIIIDLDAVAQDGSEDPLQDAFVSGGTASRSNGLRFQLNVMMFDRATNKTDDSALIAVYENSIGADDSTNFIAMPSIQQHRDNTDFGTTDTWAARIENLDGDLGDYYAGGDNHANRSSTYFFVLPKLEINPVPVPTLTYGTYLYMYVPKSLIGSSNSHITTNAGTHANGYIERVDMDVSDGDFQPTFGTPEFVNDKFEDLNGDAININPFDDDNIGLDDGSSTDAQYRPEVTTLKWEGSEAAGGHLCMFHKMYYGSTEAAPFGTNITARAFMYNPFSDKFIEVAKGGPTPIFDTVVDGGQDEADRYTWSARRSLVTYSEALGKMIYVGDWRAGALEPLDDTVIYVELGELDIGGATDITPPEIIRSILTHDNYGMGFSTTDIDTDSYALAVQYCKAEEIVVSTKYRREQGHLSIIDLLLSLYNGYIIRRGDTVVFGLMDFGAVSGALPVRTLDNDHFAVDEGQPPIVVKAGAQQDTYNRVKVNYFDRSLEYRQNYVEQNDEVDQDFRGIRAKEFPAQFVMTEALANKLAIRGLWSNLYARDTYQFNIGWKDSDLEPGDLVTLVDSFDPKLAGGVRARFTSIEEMRPGRWRASATEEIEHIVSAAVLPTSSTNQSTGGFSRGATGPANQFSMYELPKEFQGADPVVYVGWAQSEKSAGAKLWVSGDGVTYSLASDITPYTVSGIFGEPMPARPVGFVEENIDIYLFPDVRSAAFDVNSPAYVESGILEDGGETQRALGGTALWVGSEMVSYQDPTIVGSNHYRLGKVYRGWGSTPINNHNSGDFFWRHGGGVFVQPYNEDKIGTLAFYKVTPYNFSGFIWPVESVDAQQYTLQGTYHRPQVPSNAHIWVDSVDYTQTTLRGLATITTKDFKAEWQPSTRCEGYGTLGYGFSTYGHFITDALSHDWRVEVFGTGDTVVHSTVVTTPFFTYTAAQNASDNGAFRPNVAFKITPFSTFGDALKSEVVSLEFFGV